MDFLPTIYSGGYGFGGWGMAAPQQADRAPDPAEKARPAKPLDRQASMFGLSGGLMPGYDDAPPGSLGLYWQMRCDPVVFLTYCAATNPIRGGTRTFEVCKADGTPATKKQQRGPVTGDRVTSSPEDELKTTLERHFTDLWADILTGLECLNFGRWLQEVRWEKKGELVLPTEFFDFSIDEIVGGKVMPLHFNRRFAGIQYDGQRVGPPRVLHSVCNGHLDPINGVPFAEFARQDWWRTVQSGKNGDRLERKASGISMLIEMMTGLTFQDDDGNPIIPQEMAQRVFNALTSGAAAVVPMTPFLRESIEGKPELANIPAVRAKEFDWQSTAGDIGANISRRDSTEKRIARAYGIPERSVFEGAHGTLAEAETHSDVGLLGCEGIHADRVREVNKQVINPLLVTNKGPEWAGRIYVKAAPLADTEKKFLQDVAKAMAGNPADPMNRNADRKRLAGRVELPVEQDADWKMPEPPPPAGPKPDGQPKGRAFGAMNGHGAAKGEN